MPSLSRLHDVHVLLLGEDENRFTPDWLDQVDRLLDEVLAAPAPMVTTATGKFFSNGLDLDYLLSDPTRLGDYAARVQDLLARFLTLPVPTVAAISGHAFGAGAMLALAHDWRFMRRDRGFLCFPEVDIQMPFTDGASALLMAKLDPSAAINAMTTGERYAAVPAAAAGLVDAYGDEEDLLAAAVERVGALAGKDPRTLGAIKSTMYASVVAALRTPVGV